MKKHITAAFIGLAILGGLSAYIYILTNNKIVFGYNVGYQPTQPIPFSHKKHSGEYKIDCKFCHTGVDTTRHASVPSLNICMNCHMTVQAIGADGNPSPHIKKLQEAFYANKPIEWEKVHLLPDHVKFNHSAHVVAGKNCNECHGPVETMEEVYQWSSLSMGFCVNCHRKPENNAPLNCSTCHY